MKTNNDKKGIWPPDRRRVGEGRRPITNFGRWNLPARRPPLGFPAAEGPRKARHIPVGGGEGGGETFLLPPPGGRYAVFFKSGQRSGILPAFSSPIDCVVNVLSVRFLFLPGRPDKLFQREKKYIDIRERLSNLALLRFLPHSLCFAVKKVSHRVENPREGLRVRLSL